MEPLAKLFGSAAKIKVIRLFLLNPDTPFTKADISKRSKVATQILTKELSNLHSAGLIHQKSFFQEAKRKGRGKPVKKRVKGWKLDFAFPHLDDLRNLLINAESFNKKSITRRLGGVGRVKLLIISGIFIQNDQSRVDVLLVGDGLKRTLFTHALKTIESEAGCEIRYAMLKTSDFLYRVDLCDKFVRDILDYPHEKLINKLNI